MGGAVGWLLPAPHWPTLHRLFWEVTYGFCLLVTFSPVGSSAGLGMWQMPGETLAGCAGNGWARTPPAPHPARPPPHPRVLVHFWGWCVTQQSAVGGTDGEWLCECFLSTVVTWRKALNALLLCCRVKAGNCLCLCVCVCVFCMPALGCGSTRLDVTLPSRSPDGQWKLLIFCNSVKLFIQ